MTTSKHTDMKYVVLIGVGVLVTIMCSVIADKNFIDIMYLIILFVCAIRYVIVCRKN